MIAAHSKVIRVRGSPILLGYTPIVSPQLPRVLIMDSTAPRSKRQADVLSLLNVAIETMNLGKEKLNMSPATATFGSVSVILTMIRVGSSRMSVDCSLMYTGFDDQREGLRRSRANLRRSL